MARLPTDEQVHARFWRLSSAWGELVGPAWQSPFAEWRAFPGVYRAECRPAEVGENEPVNPVFPGLLGDFQGRHVSPGATGESDWAIPAGRLGEHEVHPCRPAGEGPEFWCPRGGCSRDAQQITPGGVAGVGHSVRFDDEISYGSSSNAWLQPAGLGERPQLAAQFALGVADQPRRKRAIWLGTGAAIEHDLLAAIADKQPRRRVTGRIHRPHAEQRQPQPRRHSCHAGTCSGPAAPATVSRVTRRRTGACDTRACSPPETHFRAGTGSGLVNASGSGSGCGSGCRYSGCGAGTGGGCGGRTGAGSSGSGRAGFGCADLPGTASSRDGPAGTRR